MNASKLILGTLVSAMTLLPFLAHAQQYEDDIYYNPSKKPKTAKNAQTSSTAIQTANYNGGTYTPTPDYPAAGTYNYSTGSTRDVDEYNRRNGYTVADTANLDSALYADNFTYTRRIERFHNPDVVVSSNDGDVIDYYYNTPSTSSVTNIYVNADPFWGYGWNYPYYYPSWRWSWSLNPWYWGPSYSWSWGYDPWYWPGGYYPGYNPWYPGYYPPYRPPYGGGHAWRPATPSGSSRPNRPVGNVGGSVTRRPGSVAGGSSITGSGSGSTLNRPGNMGRGRYGTPTTRPSGNISTRPGVSARPGVNTTTRPGVNTSGSGSSRGRNNSSSTVPRRNQDYNSPTRSSGSSYRQSGNSWGGSRSSGGSFGGSRSSGGGGQRGRR